MYPIFEFRLTSGRYIPSRVYFQGRDTTQEDANEPLEALHLRLSWYLEHGSNGRIMETIVTQRTMPNEFVAFDAEEV